MVNCPNLRWWNSGPGPFIREVQSFAFNTSPQPAFNKNFNLLAEDLLSHTENGYKNYILSDSEKQIERLTSIFQDINRRISFTALLKTLHEGFIDRDLQIMLLYRPPDL